MASTATASPAATGGAGAEERMDPRRLIAFLAMVVGMFMAILDIQIVSASLAEIQAGLSAGSDEIGWVQTSYLIAEVIMIPLSGTLARIVSTRVLFSVAAAGFTASSALAATATNIDQMIVYRAIQGFIGGGMIPSVFAAAFTIFPPSKRNIVSPIIGLIATLAPTIGPTVGGYLSHTFSWHWLFLVNVIPGIVVATLTWIFIDFDEPELGLIKKFDWWGLFSMAVFLGSLEYVLEEGNANDWFNDDHIVMGAVATAVAAAIFFYRAFKVEFPVVDLRAFANRNFTFGSLFSFVMGIGLYGLTYLYPLYLGRIRGYDSLMIGETMFVSGLAMLSDGAGRGLPRRQARPAGDDDDRVHGLCGRHVDDEPADGGLGFLGTARPADPARLLADALHGADQQHRARHAAAGTDPQRVRSLQPDAQPRRRRRPGDHQHDPDPAPGSPLCPSGGAYPVGQSGGGRSVEQHSIELRRLRPRRRDRCRQATGPDGSAAGGDPVLHRRVPDLDRPVPGDGARRADDQEAGGRRLGRRRALRRENESRLSAPDCPHPDAATFSPRSEKGLVASAFSANACFTL
ncbi:MFS family permease [Sinorhizobium fredii]